MAAILDRLPLAEGAQDEHGDDAHTDRGDHGTDQGAQALADPALAVALDPDEAVADQPAGEPAEEDRDEGRDPRSRRGECRQRAVGVGWNRWFNTRFRAGIAGLFGHSVIVRAIVAPRTTGA